MLRFLVSWLLRLTAAVAAFVPVFLLASHISGERLASAELLSCSLISAVILKTAVFITELLLGSFSEKINRFFFDDDDDDGFYF